MISHDTIRTCINCPISVFCCTVFTVRADVCLVELSSSTETLYNVQCTYVHVQLYCTQVRISQVP